MRKALIQAFADESQTVEFRHVVDVCRDLQIDEPISRNLALTRSAPAAAPEPAPNPEPVAAPLTLAAPAGPTATNGAPANGSSAAPPPVAQVPVLPPFSVAPAPLKPLRRYDVEPPKLSLLARLTAKLPRIPAKD